MENRESKVCRVCQQEKPLVDFYFRKDTGKHRSDCKDCFNKKCDIRYEESKEEINKRQSAYQRKHSKRISEYGKKRYAEKREQIKKKSKDWYEANKNDPEFLRKKSEYDKKRKKEDAGYRLSKRLRTRLHHIIQDGVKVGSAISDLGCSTEDLVKYLEKKFYTNPETNEQMSWSNYGINGWHIDHIKPLASFDLTDRKQFLEACHYTNLQPLWAKENLSKGAKLND